ncbi:MAG: hypothetical protein NVV59_05150 [Chitinophagaceae bacterium]|nr:hypothetical protein [Chitinophagaceae bacterium]
MRFLLICCLFAISVAGSSGANVVFNNQDPVVQFWTWFQLNEKRLSQYESNPEAYFGEIHQQLQKIAPGLAIEGAPAKDGIRNITITADGNEELFYVVQDIVNKAPALPGWRFIAFRQRVPASAAESLSIKVGKLELSVKDMKFFPIIDKDTLDVIIYAKGINDDNYLDVAYHSLILLDNLLGEYDCVMKVRSYDFHPMPSKKRRAGGFKTPDRNACVS